MNKTLEFKLPYIRLAQMPKDYVTVSVVVDGGRGVANAIKILANLLLVAIRQMNVKLYLINFVGGTAATEVPTDAEAKICIPKDDAEQFYTLCQQCNGAIRQQYFETDSEVAVEVDDDVWHGGVVNEEGTHLILAALNGIPTGKVDGITSNNIGSLRQSPKEYVVTTMQQSDSQEALDALSDNISKIFTLVGATVREL